MNKTKLIGSIVHLPDKIASKPWFLHKDQHYVFLKDIRLRLIVMVTMILHEIEQPVKTMKTQRILMLWSFMHSQPKKILKTQKSSF